jgi:hypothetical protein
MSRALLISLIVATLVALAGCGSGGSSAGSLTVATKTPREAEAEAPDGASPTLRGVYRSFQKPDTETMEPEAVSAVEAGEAACKGKTPIAVKQEFYAEAEGYLEPQQAKMIARIGKFEAREKTDQSFVAGQLAADVYVATLEEEEAQGGYQGCVYALAQGLKQRLAPKKN